MWKMLPSVKCSRLCLCTRLLIESATVDFFLNLQKKGQFGHSEEGASTTESCIFQLATHTVTNLPPVLTSPLSPHHTHKHQHSPQRTWPVWSSWDLSLTLHAQKSVLMKDRGVLIYFVCIWVTVGAKVGAQLAQTDNCSTTITHGNILQCLNIVNNFQTLQNQDYR